MQDYIPRPIDVNQQISSFSIKQYDNNSRKVHFALRDTDNPNETIVNLENHTVRAYFRLPDRSVEFVDGEVIDPDEGIIAITIPNSVTQQFGDVMCEVGISGVDDGTFISLRVFSFKVIESIRNDRAIEATEKFSALESALQTVDSFDARVTNLEESDEYLQKPLYDKTIVCFGDSLFGLYRGNTSAPAYIAAETGANVYNVGFGGCRMSVHPYTGYAEFSMWALAKAIAEGDWTSQNQAASSGSDYFTDQLEVLKGIDFNSVDIAVIHYGTNDFHAGVTLDNADAPDDYNSICGALRYSLDKLLTAYPKLRIFLSLPVYRYWTADDGTITYSNSYTNANGITLPDVCTALAEVAWEFNIPVIDGYHGLGINARNASIFLSDGVHHNELGRKRFGSYIGTAIAAQKGIWVDVTGSNNTGSDTGAESGGNSGGSSGGEATTYTNQIPISIDTDGSVFNGVGYQEGYRLSSTGELSEYPGMYVTGFIPVQYLDHVYLKNLTHNSVDSTASNQRIAFYDADKNFILISNANATAQLEKEYDENNNLVKFTITNVDSTSASTAAYFRINGSYIDEDSIITVNEEIL